MEEEKAYLKDQSLNADHDSGQVERLVSVLKYEEIYHLIELNNTDYGFNTCFDYIDSIKKTRDGFAITVFVEPGGNITKEGQTILKIIKWWKRVFKTQPKHWNYCKAGWYLWDLDELPNDPKNIWNKH